MAYSKTNWQDLPNTTTPINAIRLNNIETGIENNDKRLNGTSPAGKMVVDSIRSKNMFSFNYEVTDTSVTHIVTNNTIIQTNAGAYARSNWKITGLEIGTTYTLSCNYTNNNSCSIRMSIFDSTNTTLITETSTTTSTSGNFILTFTATETSIYIRFVTNTTSSGNTNSVTFSNIQLETGSQATNFMPYQNLDMKDSGWIFPTLNSNFTNYDTNDNHTKYRKIGNIITITGHIRTTTDLVSTSQQVIFTLPQEFRPSNEIQTLCQGSGMNHWLLTIRQNGEVTISRYGIDSQDTITTSAWLPFNVVYTI